MTKAQLKAMQAGRARAKRQSDREAVARVRQFYKWMRSGYASEQLPDKLPEDADFVIARERGAI